jgi:tetratricopeptide (TPR) repeat protein
LAAYSHYLGAMFIPRHLAVYYPYQIKIPSAAIICAVIVMGLITVLAIKNLRRRPWLMVGWLWYLGTLVPVIGLVQVGDQAWADRYTYLPLIGLFVPLVWLAFDTIKSPIVLRSLSGTVGVALIATTAVQIGQWKDTRTLFEHADRVTPKNYMAITILGSLLAKEHKYDEAMAYYQTALRYQPAFPEAHFFMGDALDEQGRLDEAIAEYKKALWFKPTQEQTHIFMGIALAKQKKYDEAMAHYNAALKLNPDSAVAQNNLARILHTLGRFDEAIEHYNDALETDPKLALAHNNLGILLIQKGNLTEGAVQLRAAMRLNPTNPETQLNLAFALNQQQQWPEAAERFSKIVRGDLPDPKAHYEFAVALAHLKRTREAMSQYASALLIQPDFPDALDGLAWILSTDANLDFRNGTEAVKMSERACELTGRQDPVKLKTLAAAYAETGRFGEATNTLRTAKDLAAKANRQELVKECSLMLEHFERSESWRGL